MPRRKAPLIAEPSPPTDPRAQALLDAHVAWQLEQLQGGHAFEGDVKLLKVLSACAPPDFSVHRVVHAF